MNAGDSANRISFIRSQASCALWKNLFLRRFTARVLGSALAPVVCPRQRGSVASRYWIEAMSLLF
jgi:hypothetical protein